MTVTRVTRKQMEEALSVVNKKYANNICWHHIDSKGSGFAFRLYTKDCKAPGARLHKHQYMTGSQVVRRGRSACWHVHGDFFDALFNAWPYAVIRAAGKKITQEEGNWKDKNVGSQMFPVMYSESCTCKKKETFEMPVLGGSRIIKTRTVNQDRLTPECWSVQVWGLDYCKTCDFRDTDDCGGINIRATGKNESGIEIPV